jgi:hypothetical protein
MSVEERFWSKVDRGDASECWEWRASLKRPGGYGQFWSGEKLVLTHRFAWSIVYGDIPVGLHVLHRCDNPPCVNPDHLFLGTHSDNVRDMYRKGRRRVDVRGERNSFSKLTREQVAEIRQRSCEATRELAREFGVSASHVRSLKAGIGWAG